MGQGPNIWSGGDYHDELSQVKLSLFVDFTAFYFAETRILL